MDYNLSARVREDGNPYMSGVISKEYILVLCVSLSDVLFMEIISIIYG